MEEARVKPHEACETAFSRVFVLFAAFSRNSKKWMVTIAFIVHSVTQQTFGAKNRVLWP